MINQRKELSLAYMAIFCMLVLGSIFFAFTGFLFLFNADTFAISIEAKRRACIACFGAAIIYVLCLWCLLYVRKHPESIPWLFTKHVPQHSSLGRMAMQLSQRVRKQYERISVSGDHIISEDQSDTVIYSGWNPHSTGVYSRQNSPMRQHSRHQMHEQVEMNPLVGSKNSMHRY